MQQRPQKKESLHQFKRSQNGTLVPLILLYTVLSLSARCNINNALSSCELYGPRFCAVQRCMEMTSALLIHKRELHRTRLYWQRLCLLPSGLLWSFITQEKSARKTHSCKVWVPFPWPFHRFFAFVSLKAQFLCFGHCFSVFCGKIIS